MVIIKASILEEAVLKGGLGLGGFCRKGITILGSDYMGVSETRGPIIWEFPKLGDPNTVP